MKATAAPPTPRTRRADPAPCDTNPADPPAQGYTVRQAARMTGLGEHTLGALRQHIEYLDRKIAYWKAIESGDSERATAIAERFFHSLRHS